MSKSWSSRIKTVAAEEGLQGLWFGALGRTVYRRLVVFERDMSPDPPYEDPASLAAMTIRILNEADLEAFERLFPGQAELFRARLHIGQQCWGVWDHGVLGHIAWVVPGGILASNVYLDYLDVDVPLAPREFYTYGAFTHRDSRHRRLSGSRQATCIRAMRALGYQRNLAVVLAENQAGMNAILRGGFRPVGTLRVAGLGRRKYWVSGWPGGLDGT